MAAQKVPLLQPTQYLAWEKDQPQKHEYISGETFAIIELRGPDAVLNLDALPAQLSLSALYRRLGEE